MSDSVLTVVLAIIAAVFGFLFNYVIEHFKSRSEMRKSISEQRSLQYLALWVLCENPLKSKDYPTRLKALQEWYEKGGGLFLNFRASDHYFGIVKLLENKDPLSAKEKKELKGHLTWLRTEMKYEVGSYSKRDKNRILPSTKK